MKENANANDDCPFCNPKEFANRTIRETENFKAIDSKYRVSVGHMLIVHKKHLDNVFEFKKKEWKEFGILLNEVKEYLDNRYHPEGYNIGWNVGTAGGQTIRHVHCHVIPRYIGDVEDPTGGIRHVIPDKANYLAEKAKDMADREMLGYK